MRVVISGGEDTLSRILFGPGDGLAGAAERPCGLSPRGRLNQA
jgi:hypothetical protein